MLANAPALAGPGQSKVATPQGKTVYRRYGKRFFDAALALMGGAVFFVPALLIALAIRWESGPPVLFAQKRIGRHGRAFTIFKFRTMRPDSERAGPVTVRGDSRVTRVGAFLRRWKLDELPQLINILRGEMSFVGPRPDVPGYADKLTGEARRLLELRPGITGPATLAFRHEEDLLARAEDPKAYNDTIIYPRKVALNLDYLRQMSLLRDIGYILRTALPLKGQAPDVPEPAKKRAAEPEKSAPPAPFRAPHGRG